MKPKPLTESQFLAILEKVLSRLLPDPKLRVSITGELSKEIKLHNDVVSFNQFCETGSVPDLQPETVAELQNQLASNFGSEATVTVTPDAEGKGTAAVEITLPDRTISSELRVLPGGPPQEEVKAPFVPFPVALSTDMDLIWVLARREDLGPDEAVRALASIEEEFWLTKAGQKQLKEGAERSFAEFIARVPAAALLESGLKRHYKEPEPVKTLQLLNHGTDRGSRPARSETATEAAKRAQAPAAVSQDDDPLSGIMEADSPPW